MWGFVGLYATTLFSEFLKYYVIQEASPRPKGAMNCNLWCNDGNQEGRPGMPSSHSAEVAFFVAYYWKQVDSLMWKVLLVLYGMAVMISRYMKRCHSVSQIVVGGMVGGGMSWLIK